MKKVLSLTLALLLCLALAACGGSGSLPDGMDTAVAEAKAKEIVEAFQARDFDTVVELYNGVEKYGLTPPTAAEWEASADAIEEVFPFDSFEGYTKTRYATAQDQTLGEYGVVVLGAKYGGKEYAWQVSFDKDMDCVGLRI